MALQLSRERQLWCRLMESAMLTSHHWACHPMMMMDALPAAQPTALKI